MALLGLILGTKAVVADTIPAVDLINWDGRSNVNGWKNVSPITPPPAQEWQFLRGYVLVSSSWHPGYPFQMVFQTKDGKFKLTMGRTGTITKDQIDNKKVTFTISGSTEIHTSQEGDYGLKFTPSNLTGSTSPGISIAP